MWVGVTIGARAVTKSIEDDMHIVSQSRFGVTSRASHFAVPTIDGVAGDALMREVIDLERGRRVTLVAGAYRRARAELSGVDVVVASLALMRDAAIARASSCPSICLARRMTAVAGRLAVRAREGPNRMIDVGSIPSKRRVAMRASAITHFGCELFAMRVRVAVHTETVVDV